MAGLWRAVLVPKRLTEKVLATESSCSRIRWSPPESTSVLETFWRRFLKLQHARNHPVLLAVWSNKFSRGCRSKSS